MSCINRAIDCISSATSNPHSSLYEQSCTASACLHFSCLCTCLVKQLRAEFGIVASSGRNPYYWWCLVHYESISAPATRRAQLLDNVAKLPSVTCARAHGSARTRSFRRSQYTSFLLPSQTLPKRNAQLTKNHEVDTWDMLLWEPLRTINCVRTSWISAKFAILISRGALQFFQLVL